MLAISEKVDEMDDMAQFIARIERSEKAFQHMLSRAKVQTGEKQ